MNFCKKHTKKKEAWMDEVTILDSISSNKIMAIPAWNYETDLAEQQSSPKPLARCLWQT